jgi:hypothetical protein
MKMRAAALQMTCCSPAVSGFTQSVCPADLLRAGDALPTLHKASQAAGDAQRQVGAQAVGV